MSLSNAVSWEPVDAAYTTVLAEHGGEDRWLLVQTVATGASRRALYGLLGLSAGTRLLDVGAGFGPLALELAGWAGCRAVGVDLDVDRLGQAIRIRDALGAAGWFAGAGGTASAAAGSGATVGFVGGDCLRLPFAEGAFDAAVCRFVLQYFPDPQAVAAELARVVAPGGTLCVVDVDDGLSIVHPEPPEAVRRLQQAFTALQARRGGDRTVGRKLGGILDRAGFDVTATLVLPQAAYGPSDPDDLDRRFLVERLWGQVQAMVGEGLIGEEEAEDGLQLLANEPLGPRTAIEGHLAVLGRRRGAPD